MDLIFDRIKEICDKKNISIAKVEADVGLSNGAIGKWRTSTPNVLNVQKVAEYLDVPIDRLIK